MNNCAVLVIVGLLSVTAFTSGAGAESMTFDQSQWSMGDMNEQYPADSSGGSSNSHLDHFYYYERIPMCMIVIDDSLGDGSPSRTYDSARLFLIVAADGLSGVDSMRLYGRRLTRPWSEYGASWNYYHASSDSAWDNAGGDFNSLSCIDTIIIDTSINSGDTLLFHLDTGFVRHLIEIDNFGWIMMAENIVDRSIFQVYTEDESTQAYRPVLTVYYTDGQAAPDNVYRRRRAMF
jgi:hypothetical protein